MTSLFLPTDYTAFTGVEIPDPVTFTVGERWLNRPMLYPRQATVIKLVFLRTDLLTDYDHQVIDEWEESFRRTNNRGIVPDIRQRADYLREQGYQHFREVLLVLGRRAGKGYLCALLMAHVLWQYMSLGDPQGFYGIDRDKQLAAFLYAGKKQQARVNLWQDLVHVIQGSECFHPYISRPHGESLTVYAPYDLVRMNKLARRGFATTMDQATFLIEPKEATMMSGRGPASFMQGYDEMAHMVTAGGASRSAEEVWNAATPALDQFKKDAFIVQPSSPWQMIGQFYQNWLNALAIGDDGLPTYPNIFMLQLESWDIYKDWELAHVIPLFPRDFEGDLKEYVEAPHPKLEKLKGAVQTYDGEMQKLEMANPETFAVERRSHWQSVVDAYLDPKKIEAMFDDTMEMQTQGVLSLFYKGHADPSTVNANYGIVIGHPETRDGIIHAVIDHVHFWRPSDFPNNTVDYMMVDDALWKLISDFKCDEFTFDQYNSAGSIQRLQDHIRKARIPKRMQVYEKTAPQPLDAGILTSSGWTTMGKLAVGDRVIGRDGKSHEVIGVYPKGQRVVYRVTFNDGGSTECTADHLWSVRSGNRTHLETRTLQEMVDRGLRYPSGPHRWAVPKVAPVEYDTPKYSLPLDPYLLGVLLGDGSLGPSVTVATSIDDAEEQMNLLRSVLPAKTMCSWQECRNDALGHRWGRIRLASENWRSSPILDELRALGLWGCRGADKFVPDSYLRASITERLALLQGLLDSDGTSRGGEGTHRVLFSSTSAALRNAIVELVGSLGGTAKVAQYGTFTPEVRISGLPEGMTPFRLSRKAAVYRPARPMDHRFIVQVDEVGVKETQCISVDVPDHLYVTDDFLLTHNTAAHNWERAENLKVSLNQGWVHCPRHEQLQLELTFLQRKDTATTHRVEKQETGPVTTKDIADCLMEVCWTLLGDQVHSYTHGALSSFQMGVGLPGGIDAHAREASAADNQTFNELGGLTSRQRNAIMRGGGMNAARNPYRRRR